MALSYWVCINDNFVSRCHDEEGKAKNETDFAIKMKERKALDNKFDPYLIYYSIGTSVDQFSLTRRTAIGHDHLSQHVLAKYTTLSPQHINASRIQVNTLLMIYISVTS